jgi:hypothetical protein
MPAKSQAQRGYLASKFGVDWMHQHHFDNAGKLPEHVAKAKTHRKMLEARTTKRLKKAFSNE